MIAAAMAPTLGLAAEVLAQVLLWSAVTAEELVSKLEDGVIYRVQVHNTEFTVDVQLLENTPGFVEVLVAVDHGNTPPFLNPLTKIFIRVKPKR